MTALRSYASVGRGPGGLAREARQLARAHLAGGVDRRVGVALERLDALRTTVERCTGEELVGRRMLDLGAGQRLIAMHAFAAAGNDVVGIDLDEIVQGVSPLGFWRMWRANGGRRVVKTAGRKGLGIDRRARRALAARLGVRRLPHLDVRRADAAATPFAGASFDVVYSTSVFSHVAEPAAVLQECARVLRPGGVAFHDFLLYTSRTGCMDVRGLGRAGAGLPLWAHLRAEHRSLVQPNAYLNEVRLPAWRALADRYHPGARILLGQHERALLEPYARALRAGGELAEYDLDELLTAEVTIVWRKPGAPSFG